MVQPTLAKPTLLRVVLAANNGQTTFPTIMITPMLVNITTAETLVIHINTGATPPILISDGNTVIFPSVQNLLMKHAKPWKNPSMTREKKMT